MNCKEVYIRIVGINKISCSDCSDCSDCYDGRDGSDDSVRVIAIGLNGLDWQIVSDRWEHPSSRRLRRSQIDMALPVRSQ